MSGGVDSSVAAAMLNEKGCNIFGITALMTKEFSRCCSDEDIQRAQTIANHIGFKHHIVDVSQKFQNDIIDYFSSEYLAARTPSPCTVCNQSIKFGLIRMPTEVRCLAEASAVVAEIRMLCVAASRIPRVPLVHNPIARATRRPSPPSPQWSQRGAAGSARTRRRRPSS